MPRSRSGCAYTVRPCFQAGEARLGVDQELTRCNDLLTFSQACEDLGVVRGLLARLHFSRLITALVEREHDERSLAGSNQRLRWHEQRGLRTATERYRREHAWLQATAAVGQFDPHGQRSEEHTSELQSLMRTSSAVFCLKKK